MIEAVMYFVLGLLAAGLVALALTPAVWRRAHRLARARIESSLPMSLGEVQAEKDQLRASYALSARRMELELADAKGTARTEVLATAGYKAEIAALKASGEEKAASIGALEGRLGAAGDALKAAEGRIEAARRDIESRDAALAEHGRKIGMLETQLSQLQLLVEEQRLELVARDTTIGNLHDQVAAGRAAEAAVGAARDEVARQLEAEKTALAAERRRREGLDAQISVLGVERADRLAALDRRGAELAAFEAELASGRAEREALAASIASLEAERAERLAEVARWSEEVARLRSAGAVHGEEETAGTAGDNMRKALDSLTAEKAVLEARVAALEAERAAAVAEETAVRDGGVADGASDDEIRSRLAEIAATVLRFTREAGRPADKGNGARLHAVPPAESPPLAVDASPDADESASAGARTLAERIRSLQHAGRE